MTAGSPEGRSSEPRSPEFAGIRTFPLIALCGALMAHLTPQLGPGVFIVGFAGFTALVTAAYLRTAIDEANTGITTAVSALLVFGLSGLCMFDQLELCAAIAIAVYLILAYKPPLRSLVRSIQSQDIYAIGKFGAVALLVLPLLPNQTYGPFDVLNPYKIWLMVVLIAAVSLVGYLAVKVLGAQLGFGLTGLLGGLVSSTAVTVTFSRKSREHEALARSCALAILLACTIMSPRILIIVGLLDAKILKLLWMPLAAITLAGLIGCGLLYWRTRKEAQEHPDDLQLSNPFELAPALKFAAVFTVILFGSKVLQHYLGDTGLYLSGAAAGLANTDPIILSMCELSADDVITDRAAVLSITLAVITNTLSKAGIALYMAAPGTRTWVASILGAQAAAGGAVAGALALWSESL